MPEARKYTASDIERYHKGQMSPGEMNTLEKAALEDPFLAEAMEGYARPGIHAGAEIDDLKERLSQRIDKTSNKGRLAYLPWLRVAAMIIFIIGAGLLVYQFAFNKQDNGIVKLEKESQLAVPDTATTGSLTNTITDSVSTGTFQDERKDSRFGNLQTTRVNNGKSNGLVSSETNEKEFATEKAGVDNAEGVKPEAKNMISAATEKNEQKSSDPVKADETQKYREKKAAAEDNYFRAEPIRGNAKVAGPSRQLQANNFRGKVTDLNNNPVPFANIMNTRDHSATYTDANGNFNIVSADTVVEVQVRSIGYELSNSRLMDAGENRVILQDDKTPLTEVVINSTKANTSRRNISSKMKDAIEPEPKDGWENYDIYIVNNLRLPDEFKPGNSIREVELSFEINKNGRPVNIKVERSLCSACDAEAIRLVKEGPAWKRTGKKTMGKVTIPFTSYRR